MSSSLVQLTLQILYHDPQSFILPPLCFKFFWWPCKSQGLAPSPPDFVILLLQSIARCTLVLFTGSLHCPRSWDSIVFGLIRFVFHWSRWGTIGFGGLVFGFQLLRSGLMSLPLKMGIQQSSCPFCYLLSTGCSTFSFTKI